MMSTREQQPLEHRANGSKCRVDVVPDGDERVILAAVGEIDGASFGVLRDAIDDVRDSGFRHIVVDLRGLTRMDSTGLHLLWEEHVRVHESGESLSIVDQPGPVRRLLKLSGLSARLGIELTPHPARRAPSGPHSALEWHQARQIERGSTAR
jgi:anti-sigma B factor antagonist